MRYPWAILAADIHVRDDVPEARTDDYITEEAECLAFIAGLQEKFGGIPVLVAGDIFDYWKGSPELLRWAIERISNWIAIPGQHDLPQHNLKLYEKSSLGVLEAARKVTVIRDKDAPLSYATRNGSVFDVWGFPWGSMAEPLIKANNTRSVALIHTMAYKGKPPFPGAKGAANRILNKMTGFDLIVTGDNHEPFVIKHKGRVMVNPGSMMRMTAAQIEHRPRVYLWYGEENDVEPLYLPAKKGVVSREHIDREKERDERVDAFVTRLNQEIEVGLSFRRNMTEFLAKNDISQPIQNIIWEAVDGER